MVGVPILFGLRVMAFFLALDRRDFEAGRWILHWKVSWEHLGRAEDNALRHIMN
jgi:hypothetical protein